MRIKFMMKFIILSSICLTCIIATPTQQAEQIQELLFNTARKYNIPSDRIRTLHNASPTVQRRRLLNQLYTDIGIENLCNEIKLIGQSLWTEVKTNNDANITRVIPTTGISLLQSALAAWNSLVRWDITSGPKYKHFLNILGCTIAQAAALYALSQQEVPAISDINAVACALIEQSIIIMNQEFITTLKKLLNNDITQTQLQHLACDAKNLWNEYNNAPCIITNLDAQEDYALITNAAEIMNANLDDSCNCCDLLRTLLYRSCTSR